MHAVVAKLRQIAPTSASVLITGESGTGKELVAKALHINSPRKNKPFVPLNCAELVENVLESELFGHVKGAFTGADRDRIGRFQYANGGTLFLDEIGDMPISIQIKLLRVLETGEIVRVGTNEPIKVNVRLISATNRDLADAIADGQVPPGPLSPPQGRQHQASSLARAARRHPALDRALSQGIHAPRTARPITAITPAVRKVLMAYSWPGNVRELKNTIESMVVIDVDGRLDLDDLTEDLQAATSSGRSDGAGGVDSLVGSPSRRSKSTTSPRPQAHRRQSRGSRQAAWHRRADALSQAQGIRARLMAHRPARELAMPIALNERSRCIMLD